MLVSNPLEPGAMPGDTLACAKHVKITIDTAQQVVQVFQNLSLVKEMPCSTGMPQTPTPKGSFVTHTRVASSQIELDGCKITYFFLTKFNGNVAMHSKVYGDHPFVRDGEKRFQERLPSSGGCVRMLMQDARWIYENVALGAVVEVR